MSLKSSTFIHTTYTHLLAYIKNYRLLIGFIFLLSIYRFCLISKGHLFWIDELRYTNAFPCIDYFINGEFSKAISSLFQAHGRPGYVLVSTIPAGLQLLLNKWGIINIGYEHFVELLKINKMSPLFNPHFFNLPSIFNVFTTLAITIIFYHILSKIIKDQKIVLLGTIVYGLLCNSNLYIRHFVPYDLALLLYLMVLLGVLNKEKGSEINYKKSFFYGFLGSCALFVYPGYYFFIGFLAILIFVSTKYHWKPMGIFLFSISAFVAMAEFFARLSNNSYIENSLKLSKTVIQGNFEESFIFLPQYLLNVEGLIGGAILCLFCVFVFTILPWYKRPLKIMMIVVILGYLFQAVNGYFLKNFVFYGRLIHMYIPFLVIGSMISIEHIKREHIRKIVMGCVLFLSLISFSFYGWTYLNLEYPHDLKHRVYSKIPAWSVYNHFESHSVNQVQLNRAWVAIINAHYPYPVPEQYIQAKMPKDMKLVFNKPFTLNFKAYQFEGFTIADRIKLKERNYKMRIYLGPFVYDRYKNSI